MVNTKSLLLICTIISLLVIGTNIDTLQPYAAGSSGQQQKNPIKSSNAISITYIINWNYYSTNTQNISDDSGDSGWAQIGTENPDISSFFDQFVSGFAKLSPDNNKI